MVKSDILTQTLIQASLKYSNNLTDLLNEYSKIGCDFLDAEGVSIFLLENRDEKYGNLRIRAGAGDIGKQLFSKKSLYYVPKREPFSKPIKIDKSIKLKSLPWKKEVDLIEAGRLPMGITAFVVRSNQSVCLTNLHDLKQVYQHEEHRGKYEETQGRKCQSIIMEPLCKKDKPIGVIKAENKKTLGVGFTPEDKRLFFTLKMAVEKANEIFERVDSYKSLFGSFFPKWFNENIRTDSIEGNKNKRIAKEINNLFEEVEFWNIYGIDNIYDKALKTSNTIVEKLDLPLKLQEIIENSYTIFEPILRTNVKYREHFIHQFNVFILGYSIINTNDFIKKSLLSSLKFTNKEIDKLIACWFLTSIFHDIAYVIQEIKKWLGGFFIKAFNGEKERSVGFAINWSDLFRIGNYEYHKKNLYEELLKKFNLGSQEPYFYSVLNDQIFEEQNHGIFSALIMMNNLYKNRVIEYKIIKEAAAAIAIHTSKISGIIRDLKGILIPFSSSPLAFLLMFCDIAQEWGRPAGFWTKNMIKILSTDLTEIETKKNINIVLEYGNVTPKLRNYLKKRQEDWFFDLKTIQLSIQIKDKEKKGIIKKINY